jgi:hypothetical protein
MTTAIRTITVALLNGRILGASEGTGYAAHLHARAQASRHHHPAARTVQTERAFAKLPIAEIEWVGPLPG